MRVLLVEDEPEMAAALRAALTRLDMIVDHAPTLFDAEAIADTCSYDAMVLDRRLPDGDGLSLIAKLRTRGNFVPILVLTARGDLSDRVAGLDQGADDYLAKPFAFDEFVARLRALLRRPANVQPVSIRAGRLSFDVTNREASISGKVLDLTRREILVLEALLRRQGRMVPRAVLMESVFALDDEVQPNALDTQISRLRRKLTDADGGVIINGVRGVGYLLREAS